MKGHSRKLFGLRGMTVRWVSPSLRTGSSPPGDKLVHFAVSVLFCSRCRKKGGRGGGEEGGEQESEEVIQEDPALLQKAAGSSSSSSRRRTDGAADTMMERNLPRLCFLLWISGQ